MAEMGAAMSDRQNDVLAAIDSQLAKCICGQPIPENGVSLDYCSDVCQYRYTAESVGAVPSGEMTYPIPPAETDGRAINAAVNTWISQGPGYCPPEYIWDDYEFTPEPFIERRAWGRFSYRNPPSTRVVWSPTAAELDDGIDLTDQIAAAGSFSFRIRDGIGGPVIAEGDHADPPPGSMAAEVQAIQERLHRSAAEHMGCTVEEAQRILTALGRILSRPMSVPHRNGAQTADAWAEAWERAAEAAAATLGEFAALAGSLYELGSALPRHQSEPLTGEDFRRRALEHQQNRGTGPKPGRRIPPRDLRR
jgi:hypothetical protein